MLADELQSEIELTLDGVLGFYDFGGARAAAILLAYNTTNHNDRAVSGLEVVIIKTPQASIKGEMFIVYLKQYREGFDGLAQAIGRLQKRFPLLTATPLPTPENPELAAVYTIKIPITPMMG